jgi:DNA-binding transcriptional LysR family regulator
MHDMHLGELDLNLLVALRALLAERHVTRAAARVSLTQPAMSHALARLRAVLGDPLLVRTRSGLQLTPRAESLAEPLVVSANASGRETRKFCPR